MADKKKRRTRSSSTKSTPKTTDDSDRISALEKSMEDRFSSMMTLFTQKLESFSQAQQERDKQTREERAETVMRCHNVSGSATNRHENVNESDPSGRRRHYSNDSDDDSPLRRTEEDIISLAPGREERDEMFTHESDDDLQSRRSVSSEAELTRTGKREKYSRYFKTPENEDNNQLNHIFGENEHKEDVGIVFDNAQINILNNSWRSSDPSKITAYKEEYKLSFPVQEKSQSILKVPALDDLLEQMLRKQHSNAKPWGKSRHLATPHMRSIENSAYQGQVAARMGLISVAYIQQALGLLLTNLKSNVTNIDSAVQTVRDIYDMSTKTLDQVGRAGAFHHIVRRKAAASDTGLSSVKDVNTKIHCLPLSDEGVFGKGLEEKLKQRKDQKEQLSDLLPEYHANKQQKRKFSGNSSSYYDGPAKRGKANDYGDRGRGRSSWYDRSRDSQKWDKGKSGDSQGRGRKSNLDSFRIPKKR